MTFENLGPVPFPDPSGIVVNMMPFVFGDSESLPKNMRGWPVSSIR